MISLQPLHIPRIRIRSQSCHVVSSRNDHRQLRYSVRLELPSLFSAPRRPRHASFRCCRRPFEASSCVIRVHEAARDRLYYHDLPDVTLWRPIVDVTMIGTPRVRVSGLLQQVDMITAML